MKAILRDELITYLFNVTDDAGIIYSVVWNKDNHTEGQDFLPCIPEFDICDEDGDTVEKGCQVFLDVVNTIKKDWNF